MLVPVQTHDKAYNALPTLLASIREVNHYRARPLEVLGIVFTMFDRTRMAQEIVAQARGSAGEAPLVFETVIPLRVDARYEERHQAPVAEYDRSNAATVAYQALAQEVMARAEASALVAGR